MNKDGIISTIRKLWVEELELSDEDFDNDTSFFDLGGGSLEASYVFDGIREELGVRLMIHLLFENHTVNAMVKLVQDSIEEVD